MGDATTTSRQEPTLATELLREEIDRDMALLGISSLAEMRRELLTPAKGARFLTD